MLLWLLTLIPVHLLVILTVQMTPTELRQLFFSLGVNGLSPAPPLLNSLEDLIKDIRSPIPA